jgi:hypothetical protein
MTVERERIEDVQYAEHMCHYTLRLIMVLTGRFRGHRLVARANMDYELARDPRHKVEIMRMLKEDLEFRAGMMTPAIVEVRITMDTFDSVRWDAPPPIKERINWCKEGF